MPKDHLFRDLCLLLSVCPSMPTRRSNYMSLKLSLKMTDGFSGIADKLSTICISQLQACPSVLGSHQLPWTAMSRELLRDTVVQMEEVTLQVPLTFLSAHTYTPLVRFMANASNLSGLSEHLVKGPLSALLQSKSISHLIITEGL